jgi:S-formylglutathione hydrolase FrmB
MNSGPLRTGGSAVHRSGSCTEGGTTFRLARLVGLFSLVSALVAAPLGSATAADTAAAPPALRPADNGTRISAVKTLDSRTLDLTVNSVAMGKKIPVRVILPKTWKKNKKATYPALWLLQGVSDDYTSWTRETDIEQLSKNSDIMIVMPDGGRAGFYADWWDYGKAKRPKWETFHTVELRQLIARNYRVNSRRAVIGLSEGGLGALNYAARHPGTFRFVGSFSGILDTSDPNMRLGIVASCLREGVDPTRIWGHPHEHPEIWNAHNPTRLVKGLRGTEVHLSAGNGDPGPFDKEANILGGMLERPLPPLTEKFASSLRKAGAKVTMNLYPYGTHSWPYWQRELHKTWPAVKAALKRK